MTTDYTAGRAALQQAAAEAAAWEQRVAQERRASVTPRVFTPAPITYVEGCAVCDDAKARNARPFIRHDNCVSPGAVGHGRDGHCTADACY